MRFRVRFLPSAILHIILYHILHGNSRDFSFALEFRVGLLFDYYIEVAVDAADDIDAVFVLIRDRLIEHVTGVPTRVAQYPVTSIVRGAGSMLPYLNSLPEGMVSIPSRIKK